MFAMATAATISATIAVIGVIIAILAAVLVISKTRGTKDTVDILATANEALRGVNADLQAQITANKHDHDLQMAAQDAECQRQLAEVRGEMAVLKGNVGRDIATAVVEAIRSTTDEH